MFLSSIRLCHIAFIVISRELWICKKSIGRSVEYSFIFTRLTNRTNLIFCNFVTREVNICRSSTRFNVLSDRIYCQCYASTFAVRLRRIIDGLFCATYGYNRGIDRDMKINTSRLDTRLKSWIRLHSTTRDTNVTWYPLPYKLSKYFYLVFIVRDRFPRSLC